MSKSNYIFMLDLTKLKNILEKDRRIIYAYLFGSYAGGYAWKESDVDVAVRLKEDIRDFAEYLKIKIKIEDMLKEIGREVDVVIINSEFCSLGMKFEIISEGKLIFCRDKYVWEEDLCKIMALYHDFREYLKELEKVLIRKILKNERK